MNGYASSVPGVDSRTIEDACGVRMIEGTSDYVAHSAFATAPYAYAERYNARMLARSGCGAPPRADNQASQPGQTR
ncbi:hypothetical protein [Brevundimonas sp. GCM10030266]|uniref:hypothetical protein n=1 Tax=Brevundimonas sp. GCM10030266 TaxID=3273386 RepID=UPI0036213835